MRAIIDPLSDDELAALMTNLGGHDIETLIETFRAAAADGDQPTCFIAYTIKGMGLPFAGHKDNHAGLMSKEQMEGFRTAMGIRPGHEWDRFEGLDCAPAELEALLAACPFAEKLTPEGRLLSAPIVPVPATLPVARVAGRKASTQVGFGDMLAEIGRGQGELKALAEHILTTSPDVAVSTSLGPWVNRRGVFDRHTRNDVFRDAKLASAQRWGMSPKGQHVELGIAEQNLFLLLGAAGLAPGMTGARLLPVGTVYDPFVNRGLDALIYACYQDARFLLVSTPSGLTLAPEGGQHQSINTPLIGMAADRLASFEPAYVDELAILLRHAFVHMQAADGSAVWLRLSTRQLPQPDRLVDPAAVIAGAHWVVPPADGARIAIAYQGPVAIEAEAAFAELVAEEPGAGLLAITSPDRLHAGWTGGVACAPGGAAGGAGAYRGRAGAAGTGGGAGDGAGRASGHACLARRGARAAGGAAGAGSFRPGGRYSGSVSGIRDGYRRHPGCLRAGVGGIAPASGGARPDFPFQSRTERCRRDRQLIVALHVQPELGRRAEIAPQPQGRVAGDRAPLTDNGLHARDRHADILREPVGGQSQRLHKFFPQLLSGMDRRQVAHGIHPRW